MAGPIRQPIDLTALSQYLINHVDGIALPIEVQQVLSLELETISSELLLTTTSLDTANPTQLIC